EPPPNGAFECSNENVINSVCRLICESGFRVVGDSSPRCNPDSSWSSNDAYCEGITCRSPGPPDHGTMRCSEDNSFDSHCTFECDLGYEMSGPRRSVCEGSGEWSVAFPTCSQIVCPNRLVLEHGSVACSHSKSFGSKCDFSCQAGFELLGSSYAVCGGRGTWSFAREGSLPLCELVTCPDVEPIPDSQIECTAERNFRSTCSLSCLLGYEVRGTNLITCGAAGRWKGSLGYCSKITCEEVESFHHGSVSCTDGSNYGSECSYSCDTGYQLTSGSKVRRCQENHLFDGIAATCTIKQCFPATPPLNGDVQCSDDSNYGSVCHITCNPGFELNVDDTVTGYERRCDANARWTNSQPSCRMVKCRALATPVNGGGRCSNMDNDAGWSGVETTCLRITCPVLDQPLHGSITCTNDNEYDSRCTDEENFDSSCRFTCDIGYELLVGSSIRSCGEDGLWSGSQVSCELIVCDLYPALENGRISCSNGARYNSRCSFTCDIGYELVGSQSRSCMESSEWSGITTSCSMISCTPLQEVENGRITCTHRNFYNSSCRFACDVGFEMQGSESRVCQADGRWNGSPVGCGIITCETLGVPLHGRKRCADEDNFESTCRFTCEIGYELEGSKSRTCLELGEWSGVTTHCVLITCSKLPVPKHGSVRCSKRDSYDSECIFSCQEGYALFGSTTRSCSVDGTWSGKITTCESIRCEELTAPNHGRLNCSRNNFYASQCTFQCNTGFYMIGTSVRTCQASHTWSGIEVSCAVVKCGILTQPSHGSLNCDAADHWNSTCEIQCDVGHDLLGTRVRTCQADGSWTGNAVSCGVVTCAVLEVPENGNMRCEDENNFESKCRFSCNVGYNLRGSKTRTCQEDGTWTGISSSCRRIRCGKTERIRHATVNCSSNDHYNSVCRYECKQGFDLVGSRTRTCQEDHLWSAPVPACESSRCGLLEPPSHGSVRCSNDDFFTSQCEFECDEGYRLLGSPIRLCKANRNWSARQPSCQSRDCLPLTAPEHGSVACTKQSFYDSECRFTCDVRYELVGSPVRICEESGGFSGVNGVCNQISCGELSAIDNGSIRCVGSNNFRSSCVYVCNNGFNLVGSDSRKCSATGEWTNSPPVCELTTCVPLRAPRNGAMDCDDSIDECGTTCSFTCRKGFTLSGEARRTCGHDMRWSGEAAQCLRANCPPLNVNPGITYNCTNESNIGSNCTFQCDNEATLLGSTYRVCLNDGTWSRSNPVCR
uniref:Sushi domain-containing protein n=1 Tax=Ciona savignyi TaxID=51511 RepID=H2Y785_CIOSA